MSVSLGLIVIFNRFGIFAEDIGLGRAGYVQALLSAELSNLVSDKRVKRPLEVFLEEKIQIISRPKTVAKVKKKILFENMLPVFFLATTSSLFS